MRSWFRRLRRERGGQGMAEYIIIVALIAIFAIGVVTLFGDNIKALFAASSDALAGQTNVQVKTDKVSGDVKTKNLKDSFNDLEAPR